ncbi:MAG: hypothetical protein WBC66_15830, partial [Candidatus Acidiferrales bacterium]
SVPEATINEYCQAFLLEYEVRLARKIHVPAPSWYSGGTQQGYEASLGRIVSFGTDTSHVAGTLLPC